ncbi:MAG: hypothetical protein JNJ50_13715 [Acidobacteria bacterium]|nr:hypothetical protein [Acidobacteriota bacterium]
MNKPPRPPKPFVLPRPATSAKRPVAPPPVLQLKVAKLPPLAVQRTVRKPVAPPVYRPQQVPKVLQTKSITTQLPRTGQSLHRPVAPPVYRPVVKKLVQPKSITLPKVRLVSCPKQSIVQPKMAVAIPARTLPTVHSASIEMIDLTADPSPHKQVPSGRLTAPQAAPRSQPSSRPTSLRLAGRNQTVQPMLTTGLVIGLAGAIYGGYRYYRHYRRESTMHRIRQEQAAHVPMITGNVEGHGGLGVTSTATTVNTGAPTATRQYQLYINLDDPVGSGGTSPSLIESARIHERTHIAADQAYTENIPGISQQIHHQGHGLYHSYPIHDRAEQLLQVIATDDALSRIQRDHLYQRVKSNAVKPIEWDSTINELLVYTRYEGIRANSNTVKLLVRYANENLEHRLGNLQRLPRLTDHGTGVFHQHDEGWPLVFNSD